VLWQGARGGSVESCGVFLLGGRGLVAIGDWEVLGVLGGSVEAPEATAGKLCVYEGPQTNVRPRPKPSVPVRGR
jgi:hypothetical protein